uniref:Uncharacterized protein n=1 Tax=Nelumbo nucifera TaxID=4432 RepID=A0A822YYR0_NELNU|nr:TPA_asm: hypothetical protein HUJ06_013567 [Nelumbo nucifera]
MDLESVKRMLERGDNKSGNASLDALPPKFFDQFIVQGLKVDLIEPGRIICTMKVPPRLLHR